MRFGIPLPTFAITCLGMAGFIASIFAVIKKDLSIMTFFSILVEIIITLWIAGEMIYPH